MNWWIHSGQGFIGSLSLPWSEWSQITDPDADHPKGTHPKVLLTARQLCHVKHFKRVLHRFHNTYITYILYSTYDIYIPLSINCLCPNCLLTRFLHSCTVYSETYYLPSNDLSLIITDSSNFIIRVVPLCQWAVTFAGYNQKEKLILVLLIIRKYIVVRQYHPLYHNQLIVYHFKLCFSILGSSKASWHWGIFHNLMGISSWFSCPCYHISSILLQEN